MIFTIIVFVAVLSLLVFVHELGHFLTARKLGVRAEEFGFGFPPRIFGVYRDQKRRWRLVRGSKSVEKLKAAGDQAPADTIYSLNWILAGGFVKIKGESGDEESAKDSFANKSAWQKALILSAGVIMNVVLAWFLLSIGYLIGLPGDLEMTGQRARVREAQVMVIEVIEKSPASQVEIQPGEVIKQVNGQPVETITELQTLINQRLDQETTLLLSTEPGRETREVIIVPEFDPDIGRGVIGVAIFNTGTISYPFFDAFWQGAKSTAMYLKLIVLAFYNLFADLIAGESVDGQVGGPLRIAQYSGEAARFGFIYLLQFVALLSLNLAIINILPIPALDGGRLLFLAVEKIKGGAIRQDIENALHMVFFFMLIALIIFVTYKDILSFF